MSSGPITERYGKHDFTAYADGIAIRSNEIAPLLDHLSIMPMTAYHYKCSSTWRLERRILSNSYWSLITEGEGELTLGERAINVRAGQLILFPARMEHALTPNAGCCMSMINVHFQARVYNLIDICGLLGIGSVFDDVAKRFIALSEEAARLYILKPPGWLSYFRSLITVQLFEIILNSCAEFKSVTPELEKLSRVYPALELIENEFNDPALSTSRLAAELHISEVYTRKLFKNLFGLSPTKFIHSRRIEYACTLLRETELPVNGIAMQSGFNDLAFFYRIFVRTMDITPAQYRHAPQF